MPSHLVWGVVLTVLFVRASGNPVRAGEPPGRGGDAAAFALLRLPADAKVNVAGSQLLRALERSAPIAPWRPRANREKMRGPAAKVYARIAPATVVVLSANGHGTGFFVAPASKGWILTNHHVVEGAAIDEKTGARKVSIYRGRLANEWMRVVDESVPALVYKTNKDQDLALLQLQSVPNDVAKLPGIDLAARVPGPGTECVAIGHPTCGALWTIRGGEIVGIGTWPREMVDIVMERLALPVSRRDEFDRILGHEPPHQVVISTCGLNPGDSGGPLVDSEGRLIAVSFGIPKSMDKDARGTSVDKFSYHVHLREVRNFLKDRPTTPEVCVPDPWPPAAAAGFYDMDEDGTDETLAFSEGPGGPLTGLLIDLDQDSRQRKPAATLGELIEDRTWDFEFALHVRSPIRAFYDTDTDGSIDLILTGRERGREAGVALERRKGAWKPSKLEANKIIYISRFYDPNMRKRLARVLNALKNALN